MVDERPRGAKVVTAEQRRRAVTWLRSSRQVSERRARRVVGLSASSYRYTSRRAAHDVNRHPKFPAFLD